MTTTLLSREDWIKVKPPLYWVKADNKSWSKIHRDLINKWLETHCGREWVYYDGDFTYAFGSEGDQTMFVIWLKSDPFGGEHGDLV